jgi:hypothetical protein
MNVPFLDLYYYTLRSKSVIDTAIWRSLKAKKSFNVSGFSKTLKSGTDEFDEFAGLL